MTPSPGATSCLGNAQRDLEFVVKYLGKTFDKKRFDEELTEGEYCALPEPIAAQQEHINEIRTQIEQAHEKYHEDILVGEPEEDFWEQPHSKL